MATTESDDTAIEGEDLKEIEYVAPEVETTCKICYAEFLDFEDLDVHVNQVHVGFTACPRICQFCDVTYTDLDDYARHIRDDHLFELICCRFCTKCFTDHKKAKKHERKHYGNPNNMYSCSQCTGLFITQKELELHEIINHDNKHDGEILKCMPFLSSLLKLKVSALLQTDEKVLICRACDFTSVDLNAYISHLVSDKCKVCVCDKCGNVFKNRKSLIKHLRRKNKCMDPKEYMSDLTTCPSCNNEVHGKQMREHLKFCRVYNCFTCDIRFESIDDLSTHQSEAHPLELDVTKCKYCPKEYVGQVALDKHVERSHRHQFILYKYACKSCDEIFKHPQNLFAHYYTKHKELEPYTCRICNKKFRVRKRFTIHIKMEHKGAGFVEFDEQYHVFFAEKKSENPFIPTCVVPELVPTTNQKKDKNYSNRVDEVSKKIVRRVINTNTDSRSAQLRLSANETGDENVETIEEHTTTEFKRKKRKRQSYKETVMLTSSEEEEAEPLIVIKKRAERKRFQKLYSLGPKKMKEHMLKRKQFTCDVCKKYCYTYQNYHNHIKIHSKNEFIECVKCSRSFMTKKELTEHISTDHATSKLIETLKSVLERKQVETQYVSDGNVSFDEDMGPSGRFMKTIMRVKMEKPSVPAKIAPASSDISVKKFIENFMPDVGETAQKEVKLEPVVTIKQYNSPFYRKHTIKMTKFTPEAPTETFKLKMPEKFKESNEQRIKLNIRLVHQPLKQSMFESFEKIPSYDNTDNSQDYDAYEDNKNDTIPDVAQEIMLDGSEEVPMQKLRAPRKIVIPKLPKGYPNIHIATLQQQAPYFKIIKVKRPQDEPIVIDTADDKETEEPQMNSHTDTDECIRLPDGTKFVTANPLAHLLGDKPVEEVLEPIKNKHYKPAITNFKGLLAEALQNLDNPKARAVRKHKKKSEKPI